MSRGPLPNPERRRRNAPTIPTTDLPASGRKGDPPEIPEGYELEPVGRAWWDWAWHLPQAAAWDKGALYTIARRAQLEDDLAAVDDSEGLVERIEESVLRILDSEDPADVPERLNYLGLLVGKLKSLGAGRLAILKEMRELDKRLGLDPKAIAELRWKFVDDGEEAEQPKPKSGGKKGGNRRTRLSVVPDSG